MNALVDINLDDRLDGTSGLFVDDGLRRLASKESGSEDSCQLRALVELDLMTVDRPSSNLSVDSCHK